MFRKDIAFKDYDGNQRKGEYYFNLNKAEIIMWMMQNGEYTLDKLIMRLGSERNGRKIMEIVEDLIHRSYGRKSLDGVTFEKTEEAWQAFYHSEAYSELFVELVTDAKKCADFIRSIIPAEMAEDVQKAMNENYEGLPDELKDYIDPPKPEIVPANGPQLVET